MKRNLIAILILTVGFNAKILAQKSQWVSLKVPQLRCWECKDRLEKYLLRESGTHGDGGIVKWAIALSTGTIRIQYLPGLMNENYIKTSIANAGFDVEDMKATEDSYKLLPPVCKRAEEGGGPQKGKPCHLPPM
ncbi:MAG: heavy metal transport/detoxification protein [Chitinophagaceae bacterium]|nr:heavy metal transport/detoxification protein [Chitinophagaceae bacterium]